MGGALSTQTPSSSPPPLSLGRRLSFSVLSLVLFCGVLELGAQLLPSAWAPSRVDELRSRGVEGALVTYLDVPGWDINPDGGEHAGVPYNTNRWWMRGPDLPRWKGSKVQRVVIVGDSSLFGHGLAWEETMSARFEAIREAEDPDVGVEIANCACPGHSTYQSRIKLERHCLAFEPDVVVIANQYSDSTRARQADHDMLDIYPHPRAQALLERSAVYRGLAKIARGSDLSVIETPIEIAQVGRPTRGEVRRVTPDHYRDNLRAMVDLSREAGAEPVFLILPMTADAEGRFERITSVAYRNTMRSLATELGVQVVDAAQHFQRIQPGDSAFMDVVHPSASGAEMIGQILADELPSASP